MHLFLVQLIVDLVVIFWRGLGYLINTSGFFVTAVPSETELGQTASIQCDLVTDESDTVTTLTIDRDATQYVGFIYPSRVVKWPNETNDRYSYDIETRTMTIQNVQCGISSDEAPTTCTIQGYSTGSQGIEQKALTSVPASVYVKVPPKAPDDIVTDPADVTSGINEGSTISATCSANVGREGKGRILWRIHRGSVQENVAENDPRLQPRTESDEENCTKRYNIVLRLDNIGVEDQDLVLTCFVVNDDFVPNVPDVCGTDNLCSQTERIKVLYSVRDISVNEESHSVFEDDEVTMTCSASGYPAPTFAWYKGVEGNATEVSPTNTYVIQNAVIGTDDGNYFCVARNNFNGEEVNVSKNVDVVVGVRPTTPEPTTPDSTQSTATSPNATTSHVSSDDDDTVIIVVVVIVVVVALIIAGIVFYCWRSRRTKEIIEEPPEKPYYNNRQNLAFQNSQPDLVTTDGKKPSAPSLNNSFDMNTEDGLRYADLTYDNRPRSRKPMAIGDTSSEYSDIQMPQV